MTKDEGWEGICGYNAAMLRPQWPVERLKRESERLWSRHVEKYGPPLIRLTNGAPGPEEMPAFTLGALLDDQSPMPEDIIAPRVLTPGGLLVLGGAPKVGKSDLLISWLVHMAAGVPFLGFTPPRPLRIFCLQAEIQYHYGSGLGSLVYFERYRFGRNFGHRKLLIHALSAVSAYGSK